MRQGGDRKQLAIQHIPGDMGVIEEKNGEAE